MSAFPEESTSEHEDELPFALSAVPTSPPDERRIHDHNLLDQSSLISSASQNAPPGLESSILSSPTDGGSQASAASAAGSYMAGSASFFKDSQFIDTAASILDPASSLLNVSLVHSHHVLAHSPLLERPADATASSTLQNVPAPPFPENGKPNSSFSTLLLAADDRHRSTARLSSFHGESWGGELSGLSEEQGLSTASTSYMTASAARRPGDESGELLQRGTLDASSPEFENWSSGFGKQDAFRREPFGPHGSQTIVPAVRLLLSTSVVSPRLFRSEERRLATLAGATATRTGDASFHVSVDLSPSCTSLREVMDVVGNPDLLLLWCDPLTDLVVTRSSEGVRNHSLAGRNPTAGSPRSLTAFSSQSGADVSSSYATEREYEGEWTEATTSQLLFPPNTSCLYSTSRAISMSLGFPSFGKLVMFVERTRGQVSLTMGPFPGRMEALHKIRIESVVEGRIRIAMDVILRPVESHVSHERVCMCGLRELMEKCLLPTTDDYMDQALSSAARLRFLIENGEGRAVADDFLSGSGHSDRHGVSTEPLLLSLQRS